MTFRVNATRFLLTYPQSSFDCDALFETLSALPQGISKAIITRELHQDGNLHVHCAVEFQRRLNSQRVSIFDHDGRHPNIQSCRNWSACVEYCRKEDAIETRYYNCTAEDASLERTGQTGDDSAFENCISAHDLREWYEWCLRHDIAFAYANAIWNYVRGPRPPTFHVNDTNGVITDFKLQCLQWDESYHTLLICGPSGCGKTTWALKNAPTPFLYVTDVDDLAFFDEYVHKSIVFDEIRCTGDDQGRGKWPLTSQIKLITWDTPCSIRVRYKLARIPAHIPKIMTCCDYFALNGDEQIKRRVQAVNLYTDRNDSDLWM